jgi:hypothetical protein
MNKPPYLALIEHVVRDHKPKNGIPLAVEIENALFGCGFRIVGAKELEDLRMTASKVRRRAA